MKKAIIAITAIPPATDMPMMGPTPRPLLVSEVWVGVGVGVSEVVEAVFVSVTVIAPVSVVEDVGVVTGVADVCTGGAVVGVVAVVAGVVDVVVGVVGVLVVAGVGVVVAGVVEVVGVVAGVVGVVAGAVVGVVVVPVVIT